MFSKNALCVVCLFYNILKNLIKKRICIIYYNRELTQIATHEHKIKKYYVQFQCIKDYLHDL